MDYFASPLEHPDLAAVDMVVAGAPARSPSCATVAQYGSVDVDVDIDNDIQLHDPGRRDDLSSFNLSVISLLFFGFGGVVSF